MICRYRILSHPSLVFIKVSLVKYLKELHEICRYQGTRRGMEEIYGIRF